LQPILFSVGIEGGSKETPERGDGRPDDFVRHVFLFSIDGKNRLTGAETGESKKAEQLALPCCK
jgi:hypothetical protein